MRTTLLLWADSCVIALPEMSELPEAKPGSLDSWSLASTVLSELPVCTTSSASRNLLISTTSVFCVLLLPFFGSILPATISFSDGCAIMGLVTPLLGSDQGAGRGDGTGVVVPAHPGHRRAGDGRRAREDLEAVVGDLAGRAGREHDRLGVGGGEVLDDVADDLEVGAVGGGVLDDAVRGVVGPADQVAPQHDRIAADQADG